MSSSGDSNGAAVEGSLDEVGSRRSQSYVVLGEVPKRPKRPTVLSSVEVPGKSLTAKAPINAEFCVSQVATDQDAQAYYNSKEEVGGGKKKVSKTNFFPKVEARSQHSKETATFDEYVPDDMEYVSSEQDEGPTRSQPSHRSTDCSKSFSQIYSEIFEESIERQQKAERACRAYNIDRSKLHERSQSRGRESATYSSLGSDYSSDLRKRSAEFDCQSVEEFDSISQAQPKHIVGYQKKAFFNTIRSSFKRLPASKNDDEHSRVSLKRSECSGRKLESKQSDLKQYYDDGEYYDESSTNRYPDPCESSTCTKSYAYSRPRKYQLESCNTEQIDGRDYLTDCRSVSGTGTSPRRSQRDYHPGSSTRHSHHYYRRLESVPKTYQDRGNSPINIKTRRQTNESQTLHINEDRDGSFRTSSVSVGVQYPSDNEDSAEELHSNIPPLSKLDQAEIQSLKPTRKSYCKESVVLNFTQLVRNVYDEDREMTDTSENRNFSGDLKVSNEQEIRKEPSPYVFDEGHSNPPGLYPEEEFTDEYSEGIANHLEVGSHDTKSDYTYEYDPNENCSEDQTDVEAVEELTDGQRLNYEEEEGLLFNQLKDNKTSDDESKLTTDSLENKPKNSLSLRIYNADEALMEIPEGFKGPAVILDDDADFLDITLTDDEEHIRAKLMAAALTTRTSNPSNSAASSRKSRRSTDSTSSILSYKPSVIFSRRSEVAENEAPPQQNDRISLLAEQVLRACANPYTDTSKWEPLATPKAKWQPLEGSEFTKLTTSILSESKSTLDGALQLLSKEFNRKLQRQIKEIAENFH